MYQISNFLSILSSAESQLSILRVAENLKRRSSESDSSWERSERSSRKTGKRRPEQFIFPP